MLYGLPKHLLNRLRSMQNTAARIVTLYKRFDHITPIMFKLHWLLLNYRIHFKILLSVYKCLNGLAPIYLSELLRYSNSPRLLRSSSQNFLALPRSRLKTYGDRTFSVVAPKLWNQLPPELRGVTSVDQFRKHLKTYSIYISLRCLISLVLVNFLISYTSFYCVFYFIVLPYYCIVKRFEHLVDTALYKCLLLLITRLTKNSQ